jgi:ATP-binding cassette subfamily F protein 3
LLFVSHDRYFLDRVATSVIVLEPERWRFYQGNYSDYVLFRKNQALESQAVSSTAKATADSESPAAGKRTNGDAQPARRKRKFPYRKVDDLEAEIHETEALVEQLEADMANPDLHRNGQRVKETVQQYEDAKSRLQRLYEHWEEAVELN